MDEKNEELIELHPDDNFTVKFIDEDFQEDKNNDSLESSDIKLAVSDDNVNTEESESVEESAEEPQSVNDDTDDYAADIEALEHDEVDDEIIKNLSDSINMQVELDLVAMAVTEDDKKAEISQESKKLTVKEKFLAFVKSKYALLIPATLVLLLFIFVGVYFITKGKDKIIHDVSDYIADNVNYQEPGPVDELTEEEKLALNATDQQEEIQEIEIPEEELEPTPEPTATPEPTPEPVEKKELVNILLIGEENIGGVTSRGRTDLIDVITLNSVNKSISVTSILRDCLVQIPNYSDNRINAVYAIGGVSLLNDTLELNFEFRPDNYILVNFDSFETVIDCIGGIDIELSAEEARYLNRTNYISKPEYRNVVAGMNHMNGNQALGYCRIRKVGTKDNEYSDFGRSSRHREVLTTIFKQLSTLSFSELKDFGDKCLPLITTDLDSEAIEMLINMILDIGKVGVNQYRIPIDGSFKTAYLRDMQVTEFNKAKNLSVLQGIVKLEKE